MVKKIIYWLLLVLFLAGAAGAVYIVNVVNTIGSPVLIEKDTLCFSSANLER